jgi:SulP family sulfate permease
VAAGDVVRFGALAAMLAILVGLVLALLGLLHMGFVSRFISAAVQAGFMFGLGLTIIVGQLPKLLGVSGGEGDFFPQLGHLLASLDEVNGWTAAIGLGSLAVLLAARRAAPTLPAALAVVVAGIAVVALFGLAGHGSRSSGGSRGPCPAWCSPRSAGAT